MPSLIYNSMFAGDVSGKTTQFCGFEDEQICGFYKESNETDTLDWSRSNGATPSSDTGPSTDHTCGNKFGKCVRNSTQCSRILHSI